MPKEETVQVDFINLEEIKKIDFESTENKQSFEKLEEENTKLIESSRVDQSELSLRFEV